MASNDDLVNKLSDGIETLAEKAVKASGAGMAEAYALAALHLAEACAWVRSPAQPHGGGVKLESK